MTVAGLKFVSDVEEEDPSLRALRAAIRLARKAINFRRYTRQYRRRAKCLEK